MPRPVGQLSSIHSHWQQHVVDNIRRHMGFRRITSPRIWWPQLPALPLLLPPPPPGSASGSATGTPLHLLGTSDVTHCECVPQLYWCCCPALPLWACRTKGLLRRLVWQSPKAPSPAHLWLSPFLQQKYAILMVAPSAVGQLTETNGQPDRAIWQRLYWVLVEQQYLGA